MTAQVSECATGRDLAPPGASGPALLAAVLARPIPHRIGSWRAVIHVHLLGQGRCTVEVGDGRGTLKPGHHGRPTCIWVISAQRLMALYAGGQFVSGLLAALQWRRSLATEIEDLIMFAKCFDHDVCASQPVAVDRSRRWRDMGVAAWSLVRGALARRREFVGGQLRRVRDLSSYWLDRVAPEIDDLGAHRWLVSTPAGLYALSGQGAVRVLRGAFNGIAVRHDHVLAFQANDHFLRPTRRGRIVRLELRGTRIVGTGVAVKGLDNACHQIVEMDGHLMVCETAQDRVLELDANLREVRSHHPAGRDHPRLASPHINSVLAIGDRRFVMCHHSTEWTGRPSEVLECDADFVVQRRRVLRGGACHCLVEIDGGVACCLSEQGQVDREGTTIARIDPGLFARGLAWDGHTLAVGGSELPHRSHPKRSAGAVFLFDAAGRRRARLPLPGAPRDIRALPWSAD